MLLSLFLITEEFYLMFSILSLIFIGICAIHSIYLFGSNKEDFNKAFFWPRSSLLFTKICIINVTIFLNIFSRISIEIETWLIVLIFILPVAQISIEKTFKLKMKISLILQMICLTAIFLLLHQFKIKKPDFYDQRYQRIQVKRPSGIILSFIVAFVTICFLLFQNISKKYVLLITLHGAFMACFIIYIWLIRDVLQIYTPDNRHYVVFSVYFMHCYAIISIIFSIINAIVSKDFKILYETLIITTIGLAMAMNEMNYSIILLVLIVAVRSICQISRLLEYIFSYRESKKSVNFSNRIMSRKAVLFLFVIFYKLQSAIFMNLLGRTPSIHNLYDLCMSFQLSVKTNSLFITRFYGVLTAFGSRILILIIMTYETIKYVSIMRKNISSRKAQKMDEFEKSILSEKSSHTRNDSYSLENYSSIAGILFEAVYSWHCGAILYCSIKLYTQSLSDPTHTWNDSELGISLCLLDCFLDFFIFNIISLILYKVGRKN